MHCKAKMYVSSYVGKEFLPSYPFKFIMNYDNSNQRVSHLSPLLPDEECCKAAGEAQCWHLHSFLPFKLCRLLYVLSDDIVR